MNASEPPASLTPRSFYDPARADFLVAPYLAYEQLRATDPVHWSERHDEWVLTRHADVRALVRNPSFYPFDLGGAVGGALNRDPLFPAVRAVAEAMVVTRSDRGHATARRFLNRVMNSRPLAELTPLIQTTTRELLAAGLKRGGLDLVKDFADVMPVRVITGLMGLPPEDAPFLAECGEGAAITLLNRSSTAGDFREINSRMALGLDYLHSEIRERRSRPRDDGLTRMIQLAPEDLPASDRDLAAHAFFLFMASMDTTTAFLGGALLALMENDTKGNGWRGRERAPAVAVEELLRFVSPLQMTPRIASISTEVGGQVIEAGQRVMLVLAAANRDPAVYAEPNRLDLTRNGTPHLSFGEGAHSCLGAALARLEGQVAFEAFVQLPPLQITTSERAWLPHDKLRKIQSLLVEFGGLRAKA